MVLPRKYHPIIYVIASISAIGGLLFGYDTGVVSGAILFIREDFHLSDLQTEIVVASILFGAIFGALLTGRWTYYLGRKKLIILGAFIFAAGTLLSALAQSISTIIGGRILLGFAIGGTSMVVPLYISEMSPPKIRGLLVSLNQVMITAGIFISYLVNLYFAEYGLWRYMLGVAILPAILLGIGMLFLPESPRWLLRQGLENRARAILFYIHSAELAELEFNEIKMTVQPDQRIRPPIFQKKYFIPLIIGIGLAIFQQITGINTIIYYAPLIFKMTGLQSNVIAILATAGVGLVNLLMTLVAVQLIDRIGRRPLLLFGVGGLFFSLWMLGLSFFITSPSPLLGWITAICLFLFVASFAISLGPIFWLLISEIYPLAIRGRAMSVATVVNWVANLLVTVTFLTLIGHLGKAYTFWLYGIITIGCWLFIYFLIPETKGRRLEEIEQSWKNK